MRTGQRRAAGFTTAILVALFALVSPSVSFAYVCEVSVGTTSPVGITSFGYGSDSSAEGVKFTASADCDAVSLGGWMGNVLSTTQDARISLYADSGTDHPGTVLATGSTISHSSLSSVPSFTHATSTIATTSLVSGTVYWLVFEGTAPSTSGYFEIGGTYPFTPGNHQHRSYGSWGSTDSGLGWFEIDGALTGSGGSSSSSTATTSPDIVSGVNGVILGSVGVFLAFFLTSLWIYQLLL